MFTPDRHFMQRYFKWTGLSILSGLLAGMSTTVFLYLLDLCTQTRQSNVQLILGLPLAGLGIGYLYSKYGRDVSTGNSLIIDEIHAPKNIVPLKMAPLILGSTLLTHLFGGSAGREGTAVQMGASLSDQLSRYFKIESEERKILLVTGTGAGFAAALGAPLAGVIFGMEVLRIGRLRPFAWFESLIACYVAYFTCIILRAPHSIYPLVDIPWFDLRTGFFVALAGILFGLAAKYFILFTHYVEFRISQIIKSPPWRPFLGGILLILLYRAEGSYRFAGLGIEHIQIALETQASYVMPLYKAIFTALTLASGFKGGEFIPLVFIGTTLGSALSLAFPIGLGLLAAVGFAAVFGAAANTPVACAVMAAEIFGYEILPYALIACFMSYYFSGERSIYKSQPKSSKFYWVTNIKRAIGR